MSAKFDKERLDALYADLRGQWWAKPEYEQLLRDTHLAVALADAREQPGLDIDPRVAELVSKHRPVD